MSAASDQINRIAKVMLWFSVFVTLVFLAVWGLGLVPVVLAWQATGHIDWASYWEVADDALRVAGAGVPMAAVALPMLQQGNQMSALRSLALRESNDVFPPSERQPDAMLPGDLSDDSTEIGPFIEWTPLQREIHGCLGVFFSILAMSCVALGIFLGWLLLWYVRPVGIPIALMVLAVTASIGIPVAIGLWLGRFAARTLRHLRVRAIGPRLTVGYDQLTWYYFPGNPRRHTLAWDRVRALWQVRGGSSSDASQQSIFGLEGDTASLIWMVSPVRSTTEQMAEHERFCRIVCDRTGLQLRDGSQAAATIRAARTGPHTQIREMLDGHHPVISAESANAILRPRLPRQAKIALGFSVGTCLLVNALAYPGAWVVQHFLMR